MKKLFLSLLVTCSFAAFLSSGPAVEVVCAEEAESLLKGDSEPDLTDPDTASAVFKEISFLKPAREGTQEEEGPTAETSFASFTVPSYYVNSRQEDELLWYHLDENEDARFEASVCVSHDWKPLTAADFSDSTGGLAAFMTGRTGFIYPASVQSYGELSKSPYPSFYGWGVNQTDDGEYYSLECICLYDSLAGQVTRFALVQFEGTKYDYYDDFEKFVLSTVFPGADQNTGEESQPAVINGDRPVLEAGARTDGSRSISSCFGDFALPDYYRPNSQTTTDEIVLDICRDEDTSIPQAQFYLMYDISERTLEDYNASNGDVVEYLKALAPDDYNIFDFGRLQNFKKADAFYGKAWMYNDGGDIIEVDVLTQFRDWENDYQKDMEIVGILVQQADAEWDYYEDALDVFKRGRIKCIEDSPISEDYSSTVLELLRQAEEAYNLVNLQTIGSAAQMISLRRFMDYYQRLKDVQTERLTEDVLAEYRIIFQEYSYLADTLEAQYEEGSGSGLTGLAGKIAE